MGYLVKNFEGKRGIRVRARFLSVVSPAMFLLPDRGLRTGRSQAWLALLEVRRSSLAATS